MDSINGLTYIKDFITKAEEKELLKKINESEWNTEIRRRTQHYGYRYPYKNTTKLIEANPIPDFLQNILEKVNNETGCNFNQIIINEYTPGQGINPHIDKTFLFGDTIVSLSLQSDIIMDFTKFNDNVEVNLDRRSIVILRNDARYKWRHAIEARKFDNGVKRGTRVSVTFRETKNLG